ncbi:MAG: Uncharacterized protein XD50_0307 [Clostridia bacterium 41_269]|nr:MAG: Uncharacterized protein XD50_0307 [Clostridia bacterium 41_269]
MIFLTAIETALLSAALFFMIEFLSRIKIKKQVLKLQKASFLGKRNKIFKEIDVLLARSGVKSKAPFFDAGNMLIFSAALFVLGVILFRRMGFASLFYASALVYVPYAGMMFLSSMNAKKIKETYLTFLTTFMGFYNIEGNIINSLKATAPYVAEPLRSILARNIFIYEKTQMSVYDCLDNIAREAGNREFRKFINFAKMNVKYGGNFTKALAKLREQAETLFSLESIKSANAYVGSLVILVMIVMNLILMMSFSADVEIANTIRNTLTGQVIAVSNAAAIVFGLWMIKHINSTA